MNRTKKQDNQLPVKIVGHLARLEHDSEGDVKRAVWFLSLLMLVAAGCGPISATKAISRAERSLAAAEAAGAEAKCPYEHTGAVAFLEYARDREGISEFEAAAMFADKAFNLAEQAKVKAALTGDGKQAQLESGGSK